MLNLEAYSVRDLQTCAGVIFSALEAGLTMEQIGATIRAEIGERGKVPNDLGSTPGAKGVGIAGTLPICPQCKRARLIPGKPYEGLVRVGCPSCRYSVVLPPTEGATKNG